MSHAPCFALSDEKLTSDTFPAFLGRDTASVPPASGALVEFSGIVRDHNDGKPVLGLEYSSYRELAVKEGEAILSEAAERFDIHGALCVHRTGKLGIGDIAVIVRAWAAHRGPAFEACSWIIDEVKSRVPIWKHEGYTDGAKAWVETAPAHDAAQAAQTRDAAHER